MKNFYEQWKEQYPDSKTIWKSPTDGIWCDVYADAYWICVMHYQTGHVDEHKVGTNPEHLKENPLLKEQLGGKRWITDQLSYLDECVKQLFQYHDRLESDSNEKTRLKGMLDRAQMKASVYQMQCRAFENLIAHLKPEWWRTDGGLPFCKVDNPDNPVNIIDGILRSADTAWRNGEDWREAANKVVEKLNNGSL
jgi:hypothetical protein